MFTCLECKRKFKTAKAAERAVNNGCPKCGGVDIDLDVPDKPTEDRSATTETPVPAAEDSLPAIDMPTTREGLVETIKVLADAEAMPAAEQRTAKPRKRKSKNVEPTATEPTTESRPAAEPAETMPAPTPQDATDANVAAANPDPLDPPIPTDEQKQAAVVSLVHKYGTKDLRAWEGYHAALKEFGLEPRDVSDERLSAASLHLHQADERMRDGIHQFNGTTETIPLPHPEKENDVAKQKKIKLHDPAPHAGQTDDAPKAKTKAKKTAKPAEAKAEGKMSALDAAVKVLAEEGKPMNAKELIEAMAARGYWNSPGGKTPDATLSAAIGTEIRKKGAQSRFTKPSPGKFALRE
jgi:hypothetical protein